MKVLCLFKPRDQIYDVELMKGRVMTRGEAADLSPQGVCSLNIVQLLDTCC